MVEKSDMVAEEPRDAPPARGIWHGLVSWTAGLAGIGFVLAGLGKALSTYQSMYFVETVIHQQVVLIETCMWLIVAVFGACLLVLAAIVGGRVRAPCGSVRIGA